MKLKFLIIAVLVSVSIAFGADRIFSELPIYPGAQGAYYHTDRPAKGVNVQSYYVALPFPAKELTDFIDGQLKSKGFEEHLPIQGKNLRKWVIFNPSTAEWDKLSEAPPARYMAFWENAKTDEIVWAYIRYLPNEGIKDWRNTVNVSIHIGRLSIYMQETKMIQEEHITQ